MKVGEIQNDYPTRALALDPMGGLGVPQTPRRSSLIAHSFTSSYAPERSIKILYSMPMECLVL
jgi:hypothetical protein